MAQIKGKKLEKAVFSILCSSISQASEYTKPLTKEQFRLLKQNTPGAFTFIFQASNKVPKIFLTKKRTIGIRIPNCKVATDIAENMGHPLLITSVPHIGEESDYYMNGELLEEKFHVKETEEGKLALELDGYIKKLTSITRQALHVTTLTFSIQGIKCQ